MAEIAAPLHVDRVFLELTAGGFHQSFEHLASALAEESHVSPRTILEALHERERAQSTAWGQGIAVPHARIAGLSRSYVALARLAAAVEYGAPDGCPVDLVVVVVSPLEEPAEHVLMLGRLARRLREPETVRGLRAARTEAEFRVALGVE